MKKIMSALAIVLALSVPAFAECSVYVPYSQGTEVKLFGINGDSLSEVESEYPGEAYLVTTDPRTDEPNDTVRADVGGDGKDQFGQACI